MQCLSLIQLFGREQPIIKKLVCILPLCVGGILLAVKAFSIAKCFRLVASPSLRSCLFSRLPSSLVAAPPAVFPVSVLHSVSPWLEFEPRSSSPGQDWTRNTRAHNTSRHSVLPILWVSAQSVTGSLYVLSFSFPNFFIQNLAWRNSTRAIRL